MGTRLQLSELLHSLTGPVKVYFQPEQNVKMEFPCIVYERDDSYVNRADNMAYYLKKRYTVTVIDRDPDSDIPDQVEVLPFTRFNRRFTFDGLYHTVFQMYF